jgi:hypothetical protein
VSPFPQSIACRMVKYLMEKVFILEERVIEVEEHFPAIKRLFCFVLEEKKCRLLFVKEF